MGCTAQKQPRQGLPDQQQQQQALLKSQQAGNVEKPEITDKNILEVKKQFEILTQYLEQMTEEFKSISESLKPQIQNEKQLNQQRL